jgi:tetratricopeptide (TPR) repeat protein
MSRQSEEQPSVAPVEGEQVEGSSEQLRRRAEDLIRKGRAEDAVPLLSRVLAVHPEDGETFFVLARAYITLGAHRAALRFAERAIRVAPDRETGHRLRAEALNALGHPLEAREALADALRLAAEDPRPWRVHVDVLLALGRIDEAATAATTLAALDPESTGSQRALAQVARASGDPLAAEAAARRYLETSAGAAEARTWLSEALGEQDRIPEAIHCLLPLVHEGSADRDIHRRLERLLDTHLCADGPLGGLLAFRRRRRNAELSPEARAYLRHEVHYRRYLPKLKIVAVLSVELALVWTGLSFQNPTLGPSGWLATSAFAGLWILALSSTGRLAVWMLQHYEPTAERRG